MRAVLLCLALSPLPAFADDGGVPVDADPVVERGEAPAQTLVNTGLQKFRGGDLEGAVAALREALAKKPGSPAIATDLGFTLGKQGKFREAELYLRKAMELDPKRHYAYANWADILAQSPDRFSRGAEIITRLEKGLSELSPSSRGHAAVTLSLANFERSLGRLAAARARIWPLLSDTTPMGARARDLRDGIATDEAAQALADWPEPLLSGPEQQQLSQAQGLLDRGQPSGAVPILDALLKKKPGLGQARRSRAKALARLSRFDEAVTELAHLLQFRPGDAEGWRLLGTLLAEHGGVLETDRAAEALRRALVLEPAWEELRTMRAGLLKRRQFVRPPTPALPVPSVKARDLFAEAQRWMGEDAPEMATNLLAQALSESPDYVDAASALFELTGKIPPATPKALWNDGNALARLSELVLRLRTDPATLTLVSPWLERAMAKNADEAPFIRALWRAHQNDKSGALADLQWYVTRTVDPPRLAEARSLRASLEKTVEDPATRARQLLLADKPKEAFASLGGPCREGVPPANLIELGREAEYEGDKKAALACYDLAVAKGTPGTERSALYRLALLAARLPDGELPPIETRLMRAKGLGLFHAHLALANLARGRGQGESERGWLQAYLDLAPLSDGFHGGAEDRLRAIVAAAKDAKETSARRLPVVLGVVGALMVLLPLLWLSWRFRGTTLRKACRKAPDLFPGLSRMVGEIRHDLLKHRASTLGMAGEKDAAAAIEQALQKPEPLASCLSDHYQRLSDHARSLGVTLRPLSREPVLGPLWHDFRRGEKMVGKAFDVEACLALDAGFREDHGPALRELLSHGPRTTVDPKTVGAWIDLVRGELGKDTVPPPAIHVDDLALTVPVPSGALSTIATNLLRNAAQAVGPDGKLQVRVESQRDRTGRRLVSVLVTDSAATPLTVEDIEARDGQRGLGIARDTARLWGGRMVVRAETDPFRKSVGVVFAAAVEAP